VVLATRFTELFGCRHPVQRAGRGGVDSPDLALAVSAAGGLGMLSGTVGDDALRAQLDVVPAHATIGVNFLVPFLDRAAVETAASRSPFVEFFRDAPSAELVELVHAGGGRAGWQIGSGDEARASRDAGCDVIVAQGVEAGGHVRGTTGLLPLLDEVRGIVDVPIVAAAESIAHPGYVQALVDACADDTVLTTAFGAGWPDAPHRVLRSCVAAGEELGAAQSWRTDWPTIHDEGRVDARALYAGQSVGAVRSRQPAAAIVAGLVEEAEAILSRTGPYPSVADGTGGEYQRVLAPSAGFGRRPSGRPGFAARSR
jgi:NAD(P)H-dependent flavin oxidoreductase YrpB (nitropropane dioxygenase family)